MAPNSAAPTRNVVAPAAENARSRNSRTSMSGRGAPQAWRTNSATSTSPPAIGTHTSGSPKPPCDSLSDRPKTIPARPGERSASPSQSSRPASARPASALSSRAAMTRATTTIGTLT